MLFEIGSSVMNNSFAEMEASLALVWRQGALCYGTHYYIRLIETTYFAVTLVGCRDLLT